MSKVQVHVGNLTDMGARFASAWNQAAAGDQINETHVTFLDMQTMLDTLTSKRLELLRHVHRQAVASVRELAQVLGRDYKNVHGDVAILEAAGLLVREGGQLMAPWEQVQATVSLA